MSAPGREDNRLAQEFPVGIDLGTTYSALAYVDATGRPLTVPNRAGDLLTPSTILIDENEVLVGKEAVKNSVLAPERYAECFKRDMGGASWRRKICQVEIPPEVLSAFVLDRLKEDGQQRLGPIREVVITVPAFFDESRRMATQDAGRLAGLDVIDIINEPTAAALAYGHLHGFLDVTQPRAERPLRVVVYDLGGGTFDVTAMQIHGAQYTTLATDGDVHLGGIDWDQHLVNLVAEQFLREHGIDPREDPRAAGKLWRECEDAKRTLSARTKALIPCDYRGLSSRVEVSRPQFEEATQHLPDRTRFTVGQTIQAAGLQWSQIDRVLLTGGSTRMPMVRAMIRESFGKEPDTSVAADEAVAHGAALRAGQLLAKSQGKPQTFGIKNVNSHSLGVVGVEPQTGRKRNGVVIPRNTPLPVTAKRAFRTRKPGQRSLLVQVVEGENPSPDDCTLIGRFAMHKLPRNLPVKSPIDVLFHYNTDGRLKVRVTLPNTDTKVDTEFTRENSLTKEHLDGWRRYISGMEATDYA